MGKPILERLFEKKNRNKMTAAEKKAQERERKKAEKQQRIEEEDYIRDSIFETEELLLKSEKQFQTIFWSEIEQARIEDQEGKKNPRRRAKIGVAYYSNQIIQAAKIRIDEQREDFEFKQTMTDMQEALDAINQLSGDIGTWDIRKIKKEATKMDNSSNGAGKSLIRTLKVFRNMDMVQDDRTPLENIMDVDDIEKWIQDPDYAAKCWKSGDAVNISADDILDNMYKNRDMDRDYEQIQKELESQSLN